MDLCPGIATSHFSHSALFCEFPISQGDYRESLVQFNIVGFAKV